MNQWDTQGRSTARKRAFLSFDFDHDLDLKNLLIGQARHDDTPFDLTDMSFKDHQPGDWVSKATTRIKGCDLVIVLCGCSTHLASGVSIEVQIAQRERVPYFLLCGRSDQTCTKPQSALTSDQIYRWTWDNLKILIGGGR